jgi:hypothetical protein
MLLTAVSDAVERYDPSREAAILLETNDRPRLTHRRSPDTRG